MRLKKGERRCPAVTDNYDMFRSRDAELEMNTEKLPRCSCCGEPVQDGYFYEINGEVLCVHCLNEYYRKDTSDYEW